MKRALIFICLFFPILSYAKSSFYLPSQVLIDPAHPEKSFSGEIQQHFAIQSSGNDANCAKAKEYILTLLIYRNAVDNKIIANYKTKDENPLCWVDLLSYSDQLIPDLNAGGWNPPKPGANTWCSSDGLKNPVLCAIMS